MRRLLVTIAVSLTALLGAAGPLAATPAGKPIRYVDSIFSKVKVRPDVTYGSAVDQITHATVTLKLDLYTPVGDTHTRRPAIVWVHGGSFCCGDKTSPELVDEATQFAMKGYVNVSIDYRLANPGCVPGGGSSCLVGIKEALQDAQTAVRFLRAKADTLGIDPTRIAIGGSSAGAITAVNVGYAAGLPVSGGHRKFSSAVEAVQSLSGCAITTTPGPGGAPALLFHGTADPLVPYSCAQATVAAAKAAGLVAALVTWPGQGHVPYVQNRTQILQTTTLFFYVELDLAHAE
jgi:acetyl esterase/lipase